LTETDQRNAEPTAPSPATPDYRSFAGRIVWPRNTADLSGTSHCPACFTPLRSAVCSSCALDLNHPLAAELAAASTGVIDALSRRVELIGQIRYETSHAVASAAAPAHAARAAEVPTAAVSSPAAATAGTTANAVPPIALSPPTSTVRATPVAPPTSTSSSSPEGAPRRSGVQVALLITGISLLSVFAVFFLVYAFINYGLVWRSAIIGLVTIAAFAGASLLRRKNLGASAEAVAVFAMLLVYLDAFAVRANNLFGADETDWRVYWGFVLVLSAVGFVAWHRLAAVRAASIVAYTVFVPGVGVLVSSASDSLHPVDATFAIATSMAFAGLAHRAAVGDSHGSRPALVERTIMLTLAGLSLVVAVFAALGITSDLPWANTGAILALAAVAGLHVAVLLTRAEHGFDRSLAVVSGCAVGALAAGATAATAWRWGNLDGPVGSILVPAIAAVIVCALLVLSTRLRSATWHPAVKASSWSAGVIAAVTLLPALLTAAVPALMVAARGLTALWEDSAATVIDNASSRPIAALTLAAALVIIAALFGVLGHGRSALPHLVTAALVITLLAAPLTGVLGLTLALWMLLASVALAFQFAAGSRRFRGALLTSTVGGTTLAWFAGWAAADLWAVSAVGSVIIVIAARNLVSNPLSRTSLLAGGAALGYIAIGAAVALPSTQMDFWVPAAVAVTGALMLCLWAIPLLPAVHVSPLDRRVQFWMSALVVVAASVSTLAWVSVPLANEQTWATITVAALVVAGGLLWVAHPANRSFTIERRVALAGLPPALNWLFLSIAALPGIPELVREIAPISAAVLAAAGVLMVVTRRPGAPRWPSDTGLALAAIPAVAFAFAPGRQHGWVVLLLGAVVALLAAVSRDGLFGSDTRRRHLGWLALALATAALWTRLADESITALEPYVVPLGAALLVVALLIWRARERGRSAYLSAAPIVALAGMLVAVLPLAVVAVNVQADAQTSPTRAIIMIAVGVLLLLGGSIALALRTPADARPYLDAAAFTGALATVIVTVGQGAHIANSSAEGALLEPWLGIGAGALIGAAFAHAAAAARDPRTERTRQTAAQVLIVTGVATILLLESLAILSGHSAAARTVWTIVIVSALHVLAMVVDRAPLTRVVAWAAFAAGGLAALLHLRHLPEIEYASVPLAVALIAGGAVHLARTSKATSWPWTGPGVALLLLPSLFSTIEDRPLWRLVALGVVGVAVIVVGVTLRLQAPFVIGIIVVLIHGLATFAPQIRSVYEFADWYVWAGIGGALLVALAIRYERRIRDLKRAVSTISALR
jgi:hypothetical protein